MLLQRGQETLNLLLDGRRIILLLVGILGVLSHHSQMMIIGLQYGEVGILGLRYLLIDSLDLETIGLHLRLVIFELGHHLAQLLPTFF